MAKKLPPLSQEDKDLALGLALTAVMSIKQSRFVVYATLDMEKPETINNFDIFGRVLLDAYKAGHKEGASAGWASAMESVEKVGA